MFVWMLMRLWILLFIVPLLTACPDPETASFTLDPSTVNVGQNVTATLQNMSGIGATVTIASVPATIVSTSEASVTFIIPDLPDDSLGEQDVFIRSGDQIASAKITINKAPTEPNTPGFSLDKTEAAIGETITATLKNISGVNAIVTVDGVNAEIKEATEKSVSFQIPDLSGNPTGEKEVVIRSGELEAKGKITIIQATFNLDRQKAAKEELVNAKIENASLEKAKLTVAGIESSITIISSTTFSFFIPKNAPTDSQAIELTLSDGRTLATSIEILGNVISGKATLIVQSGTSQSELEEELNALGFRLESSLKPLGLSSGPCSGELAEIDVGETPLGQALEQLQNLEDQGKISILFILKS